MTNTQSRFTRIFILILLLAASHVAQAARPVKVESATPSEAERDQTNIQVTISGSGFEPGAVTAVRFVLPGCIFEPPSSCDTGGVYAEVIDVPDRRTIIASVDIVEFASLGDRDIEVEMRDRGGKGTTLFRVREKNTGGQEFTTCSAAFFGGVSGICMDTNNGECDLRLGNPERIKLMTEDCVTYETIELGNTESLNSDSNIENPDGNFQMTAMGRTVGGIDGVFSGTAVVENTGHRAAILGVNIGIDESVLNVGCGAELENAVRFVLDADTAEPASDDENRASTLYVRGVQVSTATGKPLCEGIVVARTADYRAFDYTNDWKTYISENTITPLSYIQTGIRFQGIKQQQDINPPRIDNNVIGIPDCGPFDEAAGIIYGPLIDRDFDASSEALIEGNTVTMFDAGCAETTGIFLQGAGTVDTDMAGNINNNNVTGGKYGVRIDANPITDSVNMKGNTLSGDGGVAGVCSNISVREKGKPNNISGYGDDMLFNCP